MVLKSYRFKDKLKKPRNVKNVKRKRRTATGDIITGGITALLGVALLSQVAGAIKKL